MFYVKTQLSEDTVITTEITDQNVFTHCPDCGNELPIDLNDMVEDGEIDLEYTTVCCEDCYDKRWQKVFR